MEHQTAPKRRPVLGREVDNARGQALPLSPHFLATPLSLISSSRLQQMRECRKSNISAQSSNSNRDIGVLFPSELHIKQHVNEMSTRTTFGRQSKCFVKVDKRV